MCLCLLVVDDDDEDEDYYNNKHHFNVNNVDQQNMAFVQHRSINLNASLTNKFWANKVYGIIRTCMKLLI